MIPGSLQDATLLREAASEIRSLRGRVEILSAQMYVVDTFNAALTGRRGGEMMGRGEDLAWRLEGRSKEIVAGHEKETAK